MSAATIRRLLNGVTLGMGGLTLAMIAWIVGPAVLSGMIDAPDDPNDLLILGSVPIQSTGETDVLSAADDPIWSRPLRNGFTKRKSRPTPPPPSRSPQPVARPTPRTNPARAAGLTLVGTVLEDGQSVAIFSDRSGILDFRGVGEELSLKPAGVTVEAIRDREVTIDIQGRQETLTIGRAWSPKPPPQSVRSGTQTEPVSKSSEVQAPDFDSMDRNAGESVVGQDREMSIEDELDFLNGSDDDF